MVSLSFVPSDPDMQLIKPFSKDSLGGYQGISYQKSWSFLYGDIACEMIRECKINGDSLEYLNKEIKLAIEGKDLINHPTGFDIHDKLPVFIGNRLRFQR